MIQPYINYQVSAYMKILKETMKEKNEYKDEWHILLPCADERTSLQLQQQCHLEDQLCRTYNDTCQKRSLFRHKWSALQAIRVKTK